MKKERTNVQDLIQVNKKKKSDELEQSLNIVSKKKYSHVWKSLKGTN